MKDTKELKEDIIEEMTGAAEPVTEDAQAAEEPAIAEGQVRTASWWEKGVSRKFLVAALAIAMLLNAALSAGAAALFGRHGVKGKSNSSDLQKSRPGYEQFKNGNGNQGGWRGNKGNGRMTPPAAPGGNNQNAVPDNNQNSIPNSNQDGNTQNNNTQNNNTQNQSNSVNG